MVRTTPSAALDRAIEAIIHAMTALGGAYVSEVARHCKSVAGEELALRMGQPRAAPQAFTEYHVAWYPTKLWNAGLVLTLATNAVAFNSLPIDLGTVADWLYETRRTPIVEAKLGLIILALEFLLTDLACYYENLTPAKLADANLQRKLKMVDRHMKFVESRYHNDAIRKDVRNPLLHTGRITAMKLEDRIRTYADLYNLAVRLVLRSMGYVGEYLPIWEDGKTTGV